MECEDVATVERLLRTWCRVHVRRNKSLLQLAEETSNLRLQQLLNRYAATSELVAAAFSCDTDLVRTVFRRSRAATRMHLGGAELLGSRQFVVCTRNSAADTAATDTGLPFSVPQVRPHIVPGNAHALDTQTRNR